MAKKSQKLSKNKQSELLRKQGYTYREINRMDSATRRKLSELIISDIEYQKKQKTVVKRTEQKTKKSPNKHYLDFKTRVTKKRLYLDSIGIHDAMVRGKISDKKIDSIKLSDIENNRVNREHYSWLFYDTGFDFNKIYKLKNKDRMFVAFRDYQGELDIEDALKTFDRYSDNELVDFLEGIVNEPPTYQRGVSGSSSGKAGAYRFMVAPQEVIETFNKDTYNETKKDKRALSNQQKGKKGRKKKRQQYKGDKVGYQVIKDGNRVSHSTVTPRNLLITANSIMYNVTEQDRVNFYSRFYADITKHIPDMKEILPKPKF